jgi:hypothetical protein
LLHLIRQPLIAAVIREGKMRNRVYLILIIILLPFYSFASESTEDKMDQAFGDHTKYKEFFFELKDAVLNNKKEKVAELVYFPVNISGYEDSKFLIKNKKEFLLYYDSIFEKGMLATIEKQSFDKLFVNWRGVMIGSGEILYEGICEDKNCKNYTVKILNFFNPDFFNSELVRNTIEELLKAERSKLHESLQTFVEPIFQWKTEKFIIRVDSTKENGYRYAAWSSESNQKNKPDIILYKGEIVFDGSGGNHYYEFKNGAYTYRCSVIELGEDNSPPGSIEVFKKDKSILYQPVIEVLK